MANQPKGKAKVQSGTAKKPATRSSKTSASRGKIQPDDSGQVYVILGSVANLDSTPATGLTIIAYDKDMSGDTLLGQSITDETGAYEIRYSEAQFRRTENERSGADVIVRVYNARQEQLFQSKAVRNAPAQLELNVQLPAMPFVVRGTVTDSNYKPQADVTVRAFDRDLRMEQPLGDAVTDSWGKYRIVFSREKFRSADSTKPLRPELIVRVVDKNGVQEGRRLQPEDDDALIDLIVPVPQLSEWEILTQELTPLLVGQGKDGQPLPPWELNDKDITFIVDETGMEREQVRLWVLAAKTTHEVELIRLAPSISVSAAHAATNNTQGDILEFIAFYGWLRNGQPQDFQALLRLSSDTLLSSLSRAIEQRYIPAVSAKLKARVQEAIEARKVSEALKPASEGQPASLGDLLNTISGDWLNDEYRKKLAVVLDAINHESDEFTAETKKIGLNKKQTLQVQQVLQLGDLTLKHAPIVKELHTVVVKDGDSTLIGLAKIHLGQWLELAFEHGAPQQSFMSPEQYAEYLEAMVESKVPTAVLLAKLKDETIKFKSRVFSDVQVILEKYPKFDIATADIDEFVTHTKIERQTASALAILQHLKHLDARWDEVEVLVNHGLHSVAEITNYGKEQLKRIFDKQIPEDRLDAIHNKATALKAVSIGLMGYLQPLVNGVSAGVMGGHKNLNAEKDRVDSNPTLRKLFGALGQCQCDPCLSVLSPSAYLADLLKFVDSSHEARLKLRLRRPDIYDLELSCDNSQIELPHIDLAIEILENAVAFPYSIPLPVGADIKAELVEGLSVGANVRRALEKTATDKLGDLIAQLDDWTIGQPDEDLGAVSWTVKERYRTWYLGAYEEFFGLIGPIKSPFKSNNLVKVIADLDRGRIRAEIISELYPALVASISSDIPLSVTRASIQEQPEENQSRNIKQWSIGFTIAGNVKINLGGNAGAIILTSADGNKTITKQYTGPQSGILRQINLLLSQGVMPKLLVQALTNRKIFSKKTFLEDFVVRALATGNNVWEYEYKYNGTQLLAYNPAEIQVLGLSYQSTATDRDLFTRPQNRNPLAYEKISGIDTNFPWSLPFDLPLTETREILRVADISRLSLMEISNPYDDRYQSIFIAGERLGLSSSEFGLITKPSVEANGNAITKFWQIWDVSQTSQTMRDTFIDQDVVATAFGNDGLLTRVSIIMQQARLHFADLEALLESDFINPGGVKIQPDNVCQPSDMRLSVVHENELAPLLDRLHRFVRLWRAIGWGIRDLDLAIQANGIGAGRIDEITLVQIANLELLKNKLHLPIEMLVAMIGGFTDKRYNQLVIGKPQELVSLYERLFQSRQLLDPPASEFVFSAAWLVSELTDERKKIIAAAVGVRPSDLALLLNSNSLGTPSRTLNKNGLLHWVFRHVTLLKSLNLSIADYEIIWHLFRGDHFASPENLLKFLDEVEFVKRAGFDWNELEYILLNSSTSILALGLSAKRVAEILSSIQRDLEELDETVLVKTLVDFPLTQADLATPPFPGVPIDSEDRFEKHWRLLRNDQQEWVVKRPAGAGTLKNNDGLQLLARVDVLAQQANVARNILLEALKSKFVERDDTPLVLPTGNHVSITGLTEEHLDRLEIFLFLHSSSKLLVQDLGLLLEVFAEPSQWDLLKLVEHGPSILILQKRLQLPVSVIVKWWIPGSEDDKKKHLAEAIGVSILELERLITALNAETQIDLWASPSELVAFVDASASLKQRIQIVVQHVAKALLIEPAFVTTCLWDYLHTSDRIPKSAMQHLISGRFGFLQPSDPTRVERILVESYEYAILVRLHKITLLHAKWISKNNLRDTNDTDLDHFVLVNQQRSGQVNKFNGLIFDDLPTHLPPTLTQITDLVLGWKRSTSLFTLISSSKSSGQLLTNYLEALKKGASDSAKLDSARDSLEVSFNLSDTIVVACTTKLEITTIEHYRDPLKFVEFLVLLSTVQRLGVDENSFKSLVADTPGLLAAELGRTLLRTRFGVSGWEKALRKVTDNLRIQQRERLVDYLLTKWRLRDVNSLYEHYLIDVEMSPCMNTTRMLQSTAAVQLFVQRCLFNLENQVPPESIARDRWEWMQNYRVWEANRKVFLYPENWLFPEVRDDRTEAFRSFESALTNSEPSYNNAVKALQKYLDDLVEVSEISVMGIYEDVVQSDGVNGNSKNSTTLYLVGRTNNPPYSFFWRMAINYGEPGTRWTGWERIDLDLSGDHVVPFVLGKEFYLAWPIIKHIDHKDDPNTYIQLQMAWSKLGKTGWTKRKISRDFSGERMALPNRDDRSLLSFRYRTNSIAKRVGIDAYIAQPKIGSEPSPYNPNVPSIVTMKSESTNKRGRPWILSLTLRCFVKYTSNRIAIIPNVSVKIYGLVEHKYVYAYTAGSANNDPYKYYSSPIYITAPPTLFLDLGARTEFSSGSLVPGKYNLKVEVEAFGKSIPVEIGEINPEGWDSVMIYMNVVFSDVLEPEESATDITAPLSMRRFATFELGSAEESVWSEATAGEIDPLDNNSYSWSSGFRERGTGGISFLKPGFPETMFITSSPNENLSGLETWYVEEGNNKLLAKLEERHFINSLYPAGYSESVLYKNWARDSLDHLFNVSSQEKGNNPWFGVDSISAWIGTNKFNKDPRDNNLLGFDLSMPNAIYNWEVFCHLPIAAATYLTRQHRFEDARQWFHFVFDPTTNDAITGRERFWRFLPFRNAQVPDTITQMLEVLAGSSANNVIKENIQNQIAAWLQDPFNPFAVARLRPSAFEWYTVIAYIKNIVAWADQLFRRDTRESINEATLLYIMAAQILGPRPEKIRARKGEDDQRTLSYRSLIALKGDLDSFSNAWLSLADMPYGQSLLKGINELDAQHSFSPELENEFAQLSSIGSLYFCVPPNEKLPELWDMVDDRLFKIRHCQNIEGVRRELALYEPPIDPALLIRAKAAGLDLADVLADRFAPLPHYRFQVLLQKANEFCNDVKSLGGAILSAIEKKETEHLALLRSSQEFDMLKLIESVKEEQIREAEANIEALKKTRNNALNRFVFLQHQLGKNQTTFDSTGSPIVEQSLMTQVQDTGTPDGFRSLSLIQSEIDQIKHMELSNTFSVIAGALRFSSGVSHLVGLYPVAKGAAEAAGFAISATADGFGTLASHMSFLEHRSSQMGAWQRRRDEWVQQSRVTVEEIRQVDKQIIALEIRKSIAGKELDNHRKQIEHASNIDDYMRHMKFSDESLYSWMESQLAGLFFSAYQMAFDFAKKAERAYQFEFELDESSPSFVQYGHWDSLRKGLLSGEKLSLNLRRMEVAHLEQNRRELENTRDVSLRQLDGEALMRLRAKGECEFEIPEALFDMDFPGHFFRRIKSVSVTVPCVVGPYTGVKGTLTLLSSNIRNKPLIDSVTESDPNVRSSYLQIQSITTSTGQNDSGLFEFNFRDDRYLPFEGAGAISRWRFKLPSDYRAFNYDTISDLIVHVRYTARDGGEPLALDAIQELDVRLGNDAESDLFQLISLRRDFSMEWNVFEQQPAGGLTVMLTDQHFPYMFRSRIQLGSSAKLVWNDNGELREGADVPLTSREVTFASIDADDPYLIVPYKILTVGNN